MLSPRKYRKSPRKKSYYKRSTKKSYKRSRSPRKYRRSHKSGSRKRRSHKSGSRKRRSHKSGPRKYRRKSIAHKHKSPHKYYKRPPSKALGRCVYKSRNHCNQDPNCGWRRTVGCVGKAGTRKGQVYQGPMGPGIANYYAPQRSMSYSPGSYI